MQFKRLLAFLNRDETPDQTGSDDQRQDDEFFPFHAAFTLPETLAWSTCGF